MAKKHRKPQKKRRPAVLQPPTPVGLEAVQAELADLRLPKPPYWMISAMIVLVVVTWIPLALISRARSTKTTETRVHLFQDMDVQPRYGAQSTSEVFADGRAMRQPVAGTVAMGELYEDDHHNRGYATAKDAATGQWNVTYFAGFPAQVTVDEKFILRGRMQYDIFCAACHGKAGYGDGPIHLRVTELKEGGWTQPTSLHLEAVRERPEGHLFNTITNGIRNMAGYGAQIPIDDRWAIVAYLRALQLSQHAPLDAVPADKRGGLR